MTQEAYHVRVTKDYLVFSAAHFITFNGNLCERLHGHNYRVAAEVFGPLDENHYVVDFVFLRDTLKVLVDELDHYVLLPTQHPMIEIQEKDDEVEATFENRRWVFPRGDCVLLPVPNTTSEQLARYLADRLVVELKSHTPTIPLKLRVEVDENNGQVGVYEVTDID